MLASAVSVLTESRALWKPTCTVTLPGVCADPWLMTSAPPVVNPIASTLSHHMDIRDLAAAVPLSARNVVLLCFCRASVRLPASWSSSWNSGVRQLA